MASDMPVKNVWFGILGDFCLYCAFGIIFGFTLKLAGVWILISAAIAFYLLASQE